MNYTEIVSQAFTYADRPNDPEAVALTDGMLRIVEAKVNRTLLVMASSQRTQVLITNSDTAYYSLPTGFSSFRSVKIVTDLTPGSDRVTLDYVNPVKLDEIIKYGTIGNYYTIEAGQIHIVSAYRTAGRYIEYVNYGDIVPLTLAAPTNWLSVSYPDCYIYGLTAEIVGPHGKDWDSHAQFTGMFKDALAEIDLQDDRLTWSGNPFSMKVG